MYEEAMYTLESGHKVFIQRKIYPIIQMTGGPLTLQRPKPMWLQRVEISEVLPITAATTREYILFPQVSVRELPLSQEQSSPTIRRLLKVNHYQSCQTNRS